MPAKPLPRAATLSSLGRMARTTRPRRARPFSKLKRARPRAGPQLPVLAASDSDESRMAVGVKRYVSVRSAAVHASTLGFAPHGPKIVMSPSSTSLRRERDALTRCMKKASTVTVTSSKRPSATY